MYLTGTYLICRKNQNQNIFYGFFCEQANAGSQLQAGENAGSTIAGKQANKMQAGRRTGCQQLPVPSTHFRPHIFLYREPKPPACSSFPYGASGAGHYLMVAILWWRITSSYLPTITLSASVLLFRHFSAPGVHQFHSAAFRNPKMHPHQ